MGNISGCSSSSGTSHCCCFYGNALDVDGLDVLPVATSHVMYLSAISAAAAAVVAAAITAALRQPQHPHNNGTAICTAPPFCAGSSPHAWYTPPRNTFHHQSLGVGRVTRGTPSFRLIRAAKHIVCLHVATATALSGSSTYRRTCAIATVDGQCHHRDEGGQRHSVGGGGGEADGVDCGSPSGGTRRGVRNDGGQGKL